MGVYVYKSKHMDAIKIGHYSKENAWGRVINRGFYSCIRPEQIKDKVSVHDLDLICWYPTLTMKDEKTLHRILAKYNICGEWFTCQAIEKVKEIVPEENKLFE